MINKYNYDNLSRPKGIYPYIKRAADIFFSIFGMIICLPIGLVIKILYLLSGDKHSIIFKQERTGLNGKIFILYKVRSMKIENDVYDFSKKDQFTTIGKYIRKFSIDELFQVFNVFKGDMSFIGPRPWIPDYHEVMNETQRKRSYVRPGLTGYAQVNGRNNIDIFEKINNDLYYVKNISFAEDIKILLLTIKAVFSSSGVNAGKDTIKNEIEDLKKSNNKR